jgi:hypothetical protein
MNKKLFGIRVGTIITFIVCVIVAIAVWFYAEITATSETALGFYNVLIT